jgi:hypothetical protein
MVATAGHQVDTGEMELPAAVEEAVEIKYGAKDPFFFRQAIFWP